MPSKENCYYVRICSFFTLKAKLQFWVSYKPLLGSLNSTSSVLDIRPSRRREGIGRAFVDYLFEQSGANGKHLLEIAFEYRPGWTALSLTSQTSDRPVVSNLPLATRTRLQAAVDRSSAIQNFRLEIGTKVGIKTDLPKGKQGGDLEKTRVLIVEFYRHPRRGFFESY